jgi:hypothetical protein
VTPGKLVVYTLEFAVGGTSFALRWRAEEEVPSDALTQKLLFGPRLESYVAICTCSGIAT